MPEQRSQAADSVKGRMNLRVAWFTLPVAVVMAFWSTRLAAMEPTSICYAGSGKPRIDIVMCTRALMPSKALTRATLLTRRARARIQIEDDARALTDLNEAAFWPDQV